ncbi:hypothetical protein HELRODRAFT_164395 [Helobdella robusta]|uniref:Uncharacterized protein n=1 Tax=Helobdella robusta TaxID=6412 RepID=T1EVD6_HELRO|nr:hypothetical protein HELRODRAFT_164395 [Helobdella robusta]ESN94539.1 hypothetical protein HELRODRAFT_164395 [Helobdella robusta]
MFYNLSQILMFENSLYFHELDRLWSRIADVKQKNRMDLNALVSNGLALSKQSKKFNQWTCWHRYCLEQLVMVQYANFVSFRLGKENYNIYKKIVRIRLLNARSINNKVDDVYGMIYAGLDIMVLCETWHGSEGNILVNLALTPGFAFVDCVRPHDPCHGRLVIYFQRDYKNNK